MGDKLSFVSVSGKKYQKADLSLDGMRFENCQFVECKLLCSGGPVLMENCMFENCEWKMQGTAAIVVQSLEHCGWTVQQPKPKKPTQIH